MKRLFAEARLDEDDQLTPRKVLWRIDAWKNEATSPGQVKVAHHDLAGGAARDLYAKYEAALARAGAVDFGDLLVRPLRLLEEDQALRARWAGRFRHVLVDEFQDTNPVQYRLLRHLVGPARNVCVVGDDDQAIYRWRGADVRNILGFDGDFPGCRVVKLERNYRSTRNILDAAHAVIEKARVRREKKLWTEAGPGDPLALLVGQDEHDEAERVARGGGRRAGPGHPRRRDRGALPDQRPVPPHRGPAAGGPHPLRHRARHQLLRPGRGEGRRRLPAPGPLAGQRPRPGADRQPAAARHRREDGGAAAGPRRRPRPARSSRPWPTRRASRG